MARTSVLLAQLPIPPLGNSAVEGNVPLAAAYLKLLAECRGLGQRFEIAILPAALANTLGDQGLVATIAARRPAIVGFTCYLWNIERTLWVCGELKRRCPEIRIVLGGPEISEDNAWLFAVGGFDCAVIGEGEAAFCDWLAAVEAGTSQRIAIDGVATGSAFLPPRPREPLSSLDEIPSPYAAEILEPGETMFLETARGCRFRCKFCYYPQRRPRLACLSEDRLCESLRYARDNGVKEIFLLDPTLNQRPDFRELVRLLADENSRRQFTYSAELRAEGIDRALAEALRAANFAEVEIGLQSVDPCTQQLIGRPVNVSAFFAGARALVEAGIRTRVDLIVGLPGDTPESIRRGIEMIRSAPFAVELQLFHLSVLPGTALRREADALGLSFQDRPPYSVLKTPTLDLATMAELTAEAQEAFGIEFDPAPLPQLDPPLAETSAADGAWRRRLVDLDRSFSAGVAALPDASPGTPEHYAAIWLRSVDFNARRREAIELVGAILRENPFTTLDVVFDCQATEKRPSLATLAEVHAVCFCRATYLDRCGSVQLGPATAAKRLFVMLPAAGRSNVSSNWIEAAEEFATIVRREERS